jgi:phage replication-related protein YjqB (UPF0714/DUF867 family)
MEGINMAQGPSPYRSDIDVLKALDGMPDLLSNAELCCMNPVLAAEAGVAIGDQIRLKRNNGDYALYTVSALHDDGSTFPEVRMGLVGREKLGTSKPLTNVELFIEGDILRSDLSDEQANMESEFVERLTDNDSHSGLVVLAPHGGDIERETDRQAEHVVAQLAGKGVSCWCCKGWNQNGSPFDRWHINASRISRKSFPLLDSIGDRGFTYSMAFHGWSSGGILIGGTGPEQIKKALQDAIIAAIQDPNIDVSIADVNDFYNGDHPANVANWLTTNGAGGFQLEQSNKARDKYWQQIADAVASVFDQII